MNYGAVRRFFRDILGGLKDSLTFSIIMTKFPQIDM